VSPRSRRNADGDLCSRVLSGAHMTLSPPLVELLARRSAGAADMVVFRWVHHPDAEHPPNSRPAKSASRELHARVRPRKSIVDWVRAHVANPRVHSQPPLAPP